MVVRVFPGTRGAVTMYRILHKWLGDSGWVRRCYRLLPFTLRHRVRLVLAARTMRQFRFERTGAWSRFLLEEGASPLPPQVSGNEGAGVNVFCYLHGQFGLAESARMYVRALIEKGFPITLHDINLQLPHGADDYTLKSSEGSGVVFPVNLIFVNPDYLQAALEHIGRDKMQGKHVIGCWFWELQEVPADWLPALELVDEVMVATSFVEAAIRRVSNKPVLRVPLPVCPAPDLGLAKQDFGLAPSAFAFLCSFDFNSSIQRKNPRAVIAAFRQAFPSGCENVQLLVKSSNGHRYPDLLFDLISVADGDDRIIFRDEIISRMQMQSLLRCADAYVSLHRAEGFGLGMAEAMAMGKPVIATAWSGNLDFMSESNSFLVRYTMVPVIDGEYPHAKGAVWAEPDVMHAASLMKGIVDHPEQGFEAGARAAQDMARRWTADAAVSALAGRITTLSRRDESKNMATKVD